MYDDEDDYEEIEREDFEEEEELGPSRSQLKRDAEALQKLGTELVKLNQQQLDSVEMPENLRDAINEAQRLTSHGGLRRQMQYIGKIMRNVDAEPIAKGLERILNLRLYEKAQLHLVERWRDRLLIEGDAALTALVEAYPAADSQHLRQLVRHAAHEKKTNKPPRAVRMLFRYLRELMEPDVNGNEE